MNKLLFIGAILGIISVIIGALTDHAFDLTPTQADSIETAIRYNMLYAVLIVVMALQEDRVIHKIGWVFALGNIFFCGGIYAAYIFDIGSLVYVTPVGGVTLMIGWFLLILYASGIGRLKKG